MEQQIIQEYLNGTSITKLSKKYPISYYSITKLLKNNNITIRGGRKKKELPQEQYNQFVIDYYNGKTYQELENIYGLDVATLKRIVFENHLSKRNNNRINKRIKSDYFSIIDCAEKAYWLGLLFTDGSVDNYKNTTRIRLQLQASDYTHLEKLKLALCLDCKIIEDTRPNKHCYSLEFTDNQIGKDLAQYGIIPQKTYKSHNIPFDLIPPEYIPAFLLGLYDGDGGLTYSKDFSTDVTFGFTSYYETVVKDFQKQIDILINKQESNLPIFTNAWHVNWRGRLQVLNILNKLYENCPVYLDRKYEKYLLLKNSLK